MQAALLHEIEQGSTPLEALLMLTGAIVTVNNTRYLEMEAGTLSSPAILFREPIKESILDAARRLAMQITQQRSTLLYVSNGQTLTPIQISCIVAHIEDFRTITY
jgi:hypothetical protein